MNIINITEFKQNIGTYFDTLISTRKPLFIQRRKHSAIILPLDGLSVEDIEKIRNIGTANNMPYVEVTDKDWLETFSKISGLKQEKVILG